MGDYSELWFENVIIDGVYTIITNNIITLTNFLNRLMFSDQSPPTIHPSWSDSLPHSTSIHVYLYVTTERSVKWRRPICSPYPYSDGHRNAVIAIYEFIRCDFMAALLGSRFNLQLAPRTKIFWCSVPTLPFAVKPFS